MNDREIFVGKSGRPKVWNLDINVAEMHNLIHCMPFIYGKGKLTCGPEVQLMNATINLACGNIDIGELTFCGHNVMILTGSHELDKRGRPRAPFDRHIAIGKDVWLCSGCIILGPCTIGDRAVIAAGAVVSPRSELEGGWVYAGVPAKKLRPAMDMRDKGGSGPLLLPDLREKK